ncbi:LamG domain-containing protein [Phycisphaeraceae bacterium D3-23]
MANASDGARERVLDLLDQMFAGTLDAAGREELDALIRASPDAAALYVEQADLHAMLQWEHGTAKPTSADEMSERVLLDDLFSQAVEQRRLHEIEHEAGKLLASDLQTQRRLRELDLRRSHQRQSEAGPGVRTVVIPKAVVWLGVAALILLAATLVYQWNPGVPAAPPPRPPVADQPRPGGSAQPAAVPVAALAESYAPAWRDGGPVAGGGLLPGRHTLSHGWARVRTTHGVELVLEGPVAFELGPDNTVVLTRGNLVADVPDSARGFWVQTPGGWAIEDGTSFGVAVSDSGRALAHVFRGGLAVAPASGPGTEPVQLSANQSVLIRQSGVSREAAAPELFVQAVPATAYQAAVSKSRPMCCWRGPLDGLTHQLKDDGWLGADGQATMAVRHRDDGFSPDDPSGALDFGEDGHAVVSVPTHEAFVLEVTFTVEAWCWIEPGHNEFMRIVSTRGENGGFGFGVNGRGLNSVQAPMNVPVFTFFGRADFVGATPLPEGRWVHLVAVVDEAGQVSIFTDGRQATVRQADDAQSVAERYDETPLMIGRNPYTGRGVQPWLGRLDEVALYDRALSPDEIRAHYNAYQSP